MKNCIRALCLLLIAAMFAGCAPEDKEYVPTGEGLYQEGQDSEQVQAGTQTADQYLVLGYYAEDSLNPYQCSNYTNRVLFSLVYQSLFAVDGDYNTEPILCRKYVVSDDMRSYTFYLENATFSDGTKLTVQDVLASYQAAMDDIYYGGRFTHVTEITATEDGGILFALDTPCENLPILLDVPIVKASEVEAERPLGTGPYCYEEAATGLRLSRRGDWWCSSDLVVTASSIGLTPVDSVTGLRDEFEFGDVGLALADPCSDSYADYRCDYELWDCENGTFLYLGCNTGSEIFEDETLRSALTYAIDRETIVETYYNGFAQPATLPASPSSPYYSATLAQRYAYDAEKFAQAVTDGSYTGVEVEFLVNKDDTLRLKVARDIAQALEAGGLKVTMVEVSNTRYQEQLLYGTYDLYLGQTRLSANMDLSPFFRTYGTLRYGGMTDASMYALCQQALANSGNYYNLHETVVKDGRLVPVLFGTYSVHATRGLLTGLSPARDNVFCYSLGRTMTDALTAR